MSAIHPSAHDRDDRDDDRNPMTLSEGSKWAFLVIVLVTSVYYWVTVLPQLSTTAAADIGWQIPMLWAIGCSIVGTIVLSIVIAIGTAIVTRREPERGGQHVQPPDPLALEADVGDRLVAVRVQVRQPAAQGERVVLAQRLDVAHLQPGALE